MPGSDCGHAMVGDDDQVDAVELAARGQAVEQASDRGIERAQGLRAPAASRDRDRVRPRRAGRSTASPVAVASDMGSSSQASTWSTRASALTSWSNGSQRCGRRPWIGASLPGQNIVALRSPAFSRADPDRLAAPPVAVAHRFAIGQAERPQRVVRHAVVDDAVAVGTQTGDEACSGWGKSATGRTDSSIARARPRWRSRARFGVRPQVEVVGAEAVDGDQDHRVGTRRRRRGRHRLRGVRRRGGAGDEGKGEAGGRGRDTNRRHRPMVARLCCGMTLVAGLRRWPCR